MEYRQLTKQEIDILESRGCKAEDWDLVMVKEGFDPIFIRNTSFYGDIRIGIFEKEIEVSKGFVKHCGIKSTTLRNVTMGDNCLIENVGNFINNYDIGDECYISNVNTIETTEGATFGEGNLISVLNEVGDGNVMLFDGLTSQLAAFMVKHYRDKQLMKTIFDLIRKEVDASVPQRGTIGNNVKIINTGEITNTHINDDCVISGACRLSDCSIKSIPDANVYIGSGVICENSIIYDGSSILNSVKLENCFVGEACKITNGFAAENSIFFANSFMSNGEACAAFCGPFSASHHKSSLLIGGMFSFYNAGSATNFSNHAYKMGPMHYGTLERGVKTASGVMKKKLILASLSLIATLAISAKDYKYTTVGLYRDIRKWPKRDKRPSNGQKSIVNFDWLSPFAVGEILEGKKILEKLQEASGTRVSSYNYHEYEIKANHLRTGIELYDMALRIFMGAVLKRHRLELPKNPIGTGKWNDLAGLLLPETEEYRLVEDIKNGNIVDIYDILDRFSEIHDNYSEYRWTYAYRLILDYYGLDTLTEEDAASIHQDYILARRKWISEIRKDAEKEYALGDVDREVLDNFLSQLDKEMEFENENKFE